MRWARKLALALLAFLPTLAPSASYGITLEVLPATEAYDLTSTKLREIAPRLENPHRVRWTIDPSLGITGLEGVDLQPQRQEVGDTRAFGAKITSVVVHSAAHLRASEAYYRPLAEFSCGSAPDARFATREGALGSARRAVKDWQALVRASVPRLEARIKAVRGEFAEVAIRKAGSEFELWRENVLDAWDKKLRQSDGLRAEWAAYAKARGCGAARAGKATPVLSWMEQAAEPRPLALAPLARGSTRRWDRAVSIRMEVNVGGTELNGVFLFDPSVAITQVSPVWLQSQGIIANWLADGRSSLARVDGARIAGVHFPLSIVDIKNTEERFVPPEYAAVCCDGVIGRDVIRNFAWEYRPASPPESPTAVPSLAIWARGTLPPLDPKTAKPEPGTAAVEDPAWKLQEAAVDAQGRVPLGDMNSPWILDLSRGTLAVPAQPRKLPPNRIRVVYAYDRAERLARVVSVAPSKPALPRELAPGAWITEIMGYPIGRFDTWEVMRFLNTLEVPVAVEGRRGSLEFTAIVPPRAP